MTIWNYKNFTIHQFQELESTNSHAFEMANSRQIFDHEIILANSQNKGRGRQDRKWSSPNGNLYFSIVLQPQTNIKNIPQISFIAIVALQIAISKIVQNCVQAKWPNDLLIDEKKVAGILLESKFTQKECDFVILGIGLNINSHPQNTIFPADNLQDYGVNISPKNALEKFLDEFENLYLNWKNFGFSSIRNLWLKNAYKLGKETSIKLDDKIITGTLETLDEEGNLILKHNSESLKINAADILSS